MTSLYNLVKFKHAFADKMNLEGVMREVDTLCKNLDTIRQQVDEIDPSNTQYLDNLISYYRELESQIQKPMEYRRMKLAEIDAIITQQSHKLFENGYDLELYNGGFDNVRNNRKLKVYEDVEQIVKQRIMLYTNWRYPALEIGCRDGEWTQYMVAADPLYIVDPFQEFLDSATQQFPLAYQNRLRKYVLKDNNLDPLPQNQFGFVFSWGYFNYLGVETVTQMLAQLYAVMRPGGVCLFSYNDGDTPNGVGMAENFGQSYMPKSLLIPTCRSKGFEIISEQSYESNIHWLEIRKPGELHTVKANQPLGKIIQRTY